MPRAKKEDSTPIVIKQASSSRLDRFDRQGNFAGRFPTSFVTRDAATKNQNAPYGNGNTKGSGLVDPYNQVTKNRFEDCSRADGSVQNGILFLVKTILGKQSEVVLDARKQYSSEELRKQAMESIMGNTEYQEMISQINEIDQKVKLHERLMSSQYQKYIFGRSALAVVIKQGLPVELNNCRARTLDKSTSTRTGA